MNKMSPEEKLLRLIKETTGKKDKQKEKQEQTQKSEQVSKTESLFESKKLSSSLQLLKKSKAQFFNLKSINKILGACFLIILLFFIFDIVYTSRRMDQVFRQEFDKEKDSELAPFPPTLEGESSEYLAAVSGRDIFTVSGRQLGARAGVFIFDPVQYVSNLKLLGIIFGIRPQAIIEDQNEKKNYTVSVGDYLKEFLVEEVGNGKVLLDYKGQKFDLFL